MLPKAPLLLNIDHPSLNVREAPDIPALRAPPVGLAICPILLRMLNDRIAVNENFLIIFSAVNTT
jgi:hypothetical protein